MTVYKKLDETLQYLAENPLNDKVKVNLVVKETFSDKDRATLAEHGYEINGDFADNMGVLTGAIECSKLSSLEAMDFVEAAEANKKVYAT